MPGIAISCLVDASPVFVMQAWNWLVSLQALGVSERATVFVHHTQAVAPAHLRALERLGAQLVPVAPFGTGPAVYCNKLRQVQSGALNGFDWVILSDADLFFLTCPTRLACGAAVRAKPVDLANPPDAIWRKLFTEAGLHGNVPLRDIGGGASTFATNFNGGLYVLPRAVIDALAEPWAKWATFCLGRKDLLDRWLLHADQLGFGMAMLERQWPYESLDIGENCPTHLDAAFYAALAPREIHALHYHGRLDNHGLLTSCGVPWIDEPIARANAVLTASRRRDFDNVVFWDYRYRADPALGSGVGSRGSARRLKDTLLRPYLRAISRERVLDVGCGDLEVMRTMPLAHYRGIDVSAAAIEIARAKQPTWDFEVNEITKIGDETCDYAICLEVLIHQSSGEQFDALVDDLVRVSRKGVFVSGYEEREGQAGIVFRHRMLSDALRAHADIRHVVALGAYRDVVLFLALKDAGMPACDDDAPLQMIASACGESAEWPLLLDLVAFARERLGFFPRAPSHMIAYPWIVRHLAAESGRSVLDIGGGGSALPLWIAEHGHRVVVLRSGTGRRERQPKGESALSGSATRDAGIVTYDVDIEDFVSDEPFDVICAMDLLGDPRAAPRRARLVAAARCLTPSGRVLLTGELAPAGGVGTLPDEGTMADILADLAAAGLRVVAQTTQAGIDGGRPVALIEATTGVEPIPLPPSRRSRWLRWLRR